jgi:hypothetical protein
MEAAKFAARLLRDHGQEGSFEVTLATMEDCETIADRLGKLGCTVTLNRLKLRLDVHCPPSDRTAVSQMIADHNRAGEDALV